MFQLGDKYSRAMGASFMAEDGSEQPFLMGCYGVGISRTVAAIVEQHNDEHGIAWPLSVAPAHVCVIPLTVGDDEVQPAAEKLATDLARLGFEVAIDDRKERAGVKFADADLIGWPLQVIVGKRGLAEQKVEIKRRSTGARRDIPLDALTDALAFSGVGLRGEPVRGALRVAFRRLASRRNKPMLRCALAPNLVARSDCPRLASSRLRRSARVRSGARCGEGNLWGCSLRVEARGAPLSSRFRAWGRFARTHCTDQRGCLRAA